MLSHADVIRQSNQVFAQFGERVWIPNARKNAALPRRNANELRNMGLGRFAVLAALGESLEGHIETIRKYRDRIDLIVCDKAFCALAERGIIADAVLVADANIPFRWLEPHVAKTEGVKLLATAYANPEWTTAWRGPRYFYVNVDAIGSQKVFLDIMGQDSRRVPAGSNVSNALLCFLSGAMDDIEENFANYERYFLTGFDYCWRPRGEDVTVVQGNYYAFSDPHPKRNYMHHRTMRDINGDIVYTSDNLLFSAKWAWMYLKRYEKIMPTLNCSGRGILDLRNEGLMGRLEEELTRIKQDPAARQRVIDTFHAARAAFEAYRATKNAFQNAKGGLTWQ